MTDRLPGVPAGGQFAVNPQAPAEFELTGHETGAFDSTGWGSPEPKQPIVTARQLMDRIHRVNAMREHAPAPYLDEALSDLLSNYRDAVCRER